MSRLLNPKIPFKPYQSLGFTLIEMIVTIVIVGILGVGIASFMGRTTQGLVDTADRNKIAAIAWIVSEKVTRELRLALPNSVRVETVSGNECLEFVPTIAATDYVSIPSITTGTTFNVVPFPNYTAASVNTAQDRVSVYPNAVSTDALYAFSPASPHVISPTIASLGAGTVTGANLVTLSSTHLFTTDSPTKRLYIVQDPVMFCFDGGFLYRYSGYGFDYSDGLQNQQVIADGIESGSFAYTLESLVRNAVVNLNYTILGDNSERQTIGQEVQIRNVP